MPGGEALCKNVPLPRNLFDLYNACSNVHASYVA